MAKKQVNKMDEIKIELDKLIVQFSITNDESLLPIIKELQAKIDYFNYGIK
jgi:hypothetical protein